MPSRPPSRPFSAGPLSAGALSARARATDDGGVSGAPIEQVIACGRDELRGGLGILGIRARRQSRDAGIGGIVGGCDDLGQLLDESREVQPLDRGETKPDFARVHCGAFRTVAQSP